MLGSWKHGTCIVNLYIIWKIKKKKLTLAKVRQTRYIRIGNLGILGQPIMRRDFSRMLRVCGETATCRPSRAIGGSSLLLSTQIGNSRSLNFRSVCERVSNYAHFYGVILLFNTPSYLTMFFIILVGDFLTHFN